MSARRVVFVCTHNSARSQLAAALWAGRSRIPAASAGTRPARRIHPRTVRTARRHGLALLASATADVTDVLASDDLVVAVCDNAHEQLPRDAGTAALVGSRPGPGRQRRVHSKPPTGTYPDASTVSCPCSQSEANHD